MDIEIIYLGYDNVIDLLLKKDDGQGLIVADLSDITKMTITFGSTTIQSTNLVTDPITWAKSGYLTGEVRMVLGTKSITAGTYKAKLVVYDATYIHGLVWGYIPITVK